MAVKLTVGTAVYNVGEEFLRAHIEGIRGQLTDETELLLIDDCSTDNSGEICKKYAEEDEHIRYIKMEKNSGLSSVRNRTIKEASGKWIFFVDGDDLLSDHFAEAALAFYDTDYDIIIHDRAIFSDEKEADETCAVTKLTELPDGAGRELSKSCLCINPIDRKKLKLGSNVFYHAAWGALYRKDFLTENGLLFPEKQKKAQDSVFNTYAYFAAKKIAYLPYVMYYYRKNMLGITKRYSADFIDMALSLMKHHYECIDALYKDDGEVKDLYKQYRSVSLTLDSMKLNYFHKDNPKPRAQRKEEFLKFADTEPFKSVINDFVIKKSDWWGWWLPMFYAKKRKFGMLEFAFRHEKAFQIYGGIIGRLKKVD